MDDDLSMIERLRFREMTSYFAAVGINLDDTSYQRMTSDPVLPDDAVITALTQTGPLRLQCDRAFVSLIGQEWQYIIAESTPTLPYRQAELKQTDKMCAGVTRLPRESAICLHTIGCFTDLTGLSAINDSNTQADLTKCMIRDLRQDPVFGSRLSVRNWPYMRAYLEVPLRTSTGLVIGSYTVVDTNLRDDFDENATLIMVEIAQNIMDHLDLLKIKQQCERAERLVRGLSVFVDGCSSLRGLPQDDRDHTPAYTVPLNESLLGMDSNQTPPCFPNLDSSKASATTSCSRDAEVFSNSTDIASSISSAPDIDQPDRQGDPAKVGEGPQSLDRSPPKSSPPPSLRDAKMAFSRAANLIREGTSIEGLVFLDACPSGFGTLRNTRRCADRNASDETTAEDIDDGATCEILGSSTGSYTAPINQDFKVPEALLQRLIHGNPCGRLIHADEHGPISPAYAGSVGDGVDRKGGGGSKDDIEQLFRIVPQARSILFLPLWDYHKEIWYAATIGWTTDPTRSFEEGDMTYMSAFSNSIMIEVARLDALVTSAAKGNFISSISHEFRSPLHGIMASVELLDETPQDPDQRQLTGMIKSCATTLLDTTTHLLDFAKINSLVKDDRRPQPHRASPSSEGQLDTALSSRVDLARLVEEVVEGAYVGHASHASTKLLRDDAADDDEDDDDGQRPRGPPPVLVTMEIEKRAGWSLRTEPGAWRRIVMNVFGNALKYTARGSIVASLRTVQTPPAALAPPGEPPRTDICFAVRDTGCGMSTDYVKRQLFTPYAQENPLSAGVGLGLSIVQHLVKELGGTVGVESEPGAGTLVQVTVPTSSSSPLREASAAAAARTDAEGGSAKALRGKAVAVLELDTSENSLLPAFTSMAQTWLGVDVLTPEGGDAGGGMPLVVLCNSAPTARQKRTAVFQNATFMVQPFGPRKLARTVATAFARHAARADAAGGRPTNLEPTTAQLSVTAPIATSTAPQALQTAASLPPHVLVVDDNSVNRKILTTYLTKLHCTYRIATNGLEAVQAFRTAVAAQPFDYIFMDISMPVMNGLEATREIRADERGGKTRTSIIALTGLGASSSQKEAFASGVDTYLMKPVALRKLRDLVLGGRGG